MNKTAIKNFAIWARVNLIESAKQRAFEYEITKDGVNTSSVDVIAGRVLTKEEKEQRNQLLNEIKDKGFDQVMEEAAYTWFNRFIALRYMEVNGYLPSKVRVFSNEEGEFKPAILDEAITVEIEGLDREKVLDLLDKQDNENLYKTLLIAQCNSLSVGLPYMFEKISNWTELLFPKNLLKKESVIGQMVTMIPENDWEDAVQIIGWLYQYYNSELKDETFALSKKKVKITKERIPAATQLFTPDWIVRYLVENSLGHLWADSHVSFDSESIWKYFLPLAEQDSTSSCDLAVVNKKYEAIKPEMIKFIDPCMGSGHILVYAFDVFMQIYTSEGWSERDAAKSIIENNLYGLDIDDRAGQLASFAIMMKARKYNRRILQEDTRLNVLSIKDSSFIDEPFISYFSNGDSNVAKEIRSLCEELRYAKEYGSIIKVDDIKFEILERQIETKLNQNADNIFDLLYQNIIIEKLVPMMKAAKMLSTQYDVVVTNPPYMGVANGSERLSSYVKKHYEDGKEDLYTVFMMRCSEFAKPFGYQAMITQHTWMFLSRAEKLRRNILNNMLLSVAHLGPRAFDEIGGEVVQTAAFVFRKSHINNFTGIYCRAVDGMSEKEKETIFVSHEHDYVFCQDEFDLIPGSIMAYWISKSFLHNFKYNSFDDEVNSRVGLDTGDNDKFLRFWNEVDFSKIKFSVPDVETLHGEYSNYRYVPHTKGGSYRKWYGNFDYVIKFDSLSYAELLESGNHLPSRQFYFLEGLTWTRVSSKFAVRYTPCGMVFNSACPTVFGDKKWIYYTLGLLNSNVVKFYAELLSPTINFQAGDIGKIPYIKNEEFLARITELVKENISLSEADWNEKENSWDFGTHPMLIEGEGVESSYNKWVERSKNRLTKMKANEEELNSIFATIYGVRDELTIEVKEEDVSVSVVSRKEAVQSLISYAVGCIFGRYDINSPGIQFAGGKLNIEGGLVDKDNIIPVCDDEYFSDDIVNKFVEFIAYAYGREGLEENLNYISKTLGGNGASREIIRNYFLNDFYKDHCNMYQVAGAGKRPIYWLFDSGKKNGFKCLIYMHRYQPDTIARIRTDYIHELQARYRTAIEEIERNMDSADAKERVKMNKQLSKLQDQELELRAYEEKIHHLADQMIEIDLDDGVKANYAKFQDVLAPIK